MLIHLASSTLKTQYGEYREMLFYDGQKEYVAMVLGDVQGEAGVLCRVHSSCIYGHYFNSIECDCRQQMEDAQQRIQAAGKGIIILLDQEGKGNGHLALIQSRKFKQQGLTQADAYEAAGFKRDARNFSQAAEILKSLAVQSVQLLTDNPKKSETLRQHGVEVMVAG